MEPYKQEKNLFSQEIDKKEKRKLKAQSDNQRSVWFGLGMFGMVGWSIALPTLLGTALGIWLDKHNPESFSWTLTFLCLGLFVGSLIAWYWVAKEDKEIHQNKAEKDE